MSRLPVALTVTILAFTVLLPTSPGFADAGEDLTKGRAALDAGQLDEAVRLLESAAEGLPDSVEAQLALARCYLRVGDLEKARAAYARVLKLSPDHREAKRVIDGLTGAKARFDQNLAAAEALLELGQHHAARRIVAALTREAAPDQQILLARLTLARIDLLRNQPNDALAEALQLIQETDDAAIAGPAHLVAALALLADDGTIEDRLPAIESYLRKAGKTKWQPYERLAQLLLDARATEYQKVMRLTGSVRVAPGLSTVHPFVRDGLNRVLQRIADTAAQRAQAGDHTDATRLAWAMLSEKNAPDAKAVLKDIDFGKGMEADPSWQLHVKLRAAHLLTAAAAAESQREADDATLIGYWIAHRALLPHAADRECLNRLLQQVEQLASMSHPRLHVEGRALSQADAIQRAMILDIAGATSEQRANAALARAVRQQIERYKAQGDVTTGLAQFVEVARDNDPLTFRLVSTLVNMPEGDAHRELLAYLAGEYAELGRIAYAEAQESISATDDDMLTQPDMVALAIERALADIYPRRHNETRVNGIIERYAAAQKWTAAETALSVYYRTPESLEFTWARANLTVRRVVTEENQLLTAGRKIDDKLNPAIVNAIKQVVAALGKHPAETMRMRVIRFIQPISSRYVQLDRLDLSEQVIAAARDAGKGLPGALTLEDWALWTRILTLEGQAQQALAKAAAELKGDARVALDKHHQQELALLRELLRQHPESDQAPHAIEQVLRIVRTYERYASFEVAQGVLNDFLKAFPELAKGERLAYRVVELALAKAQHAFAAEQAKLKPGEKPVALSEEYKEAIKAIDAFLEAHRQGMRAPSAEDQLLEVARVYGRVGAWGVSRTVLDAYAKAMTDHRLPAHLDLLRAATYLGELDGEHGLSLLQPLPRQAPQPIGVWRAIDGLDGGGTLSLADGRVDPRGRTWDDKLDEYAERRNGRQPRPTAGAIREPMQQGQQSQGSQAGHGQPGGAQSGPANRYYEQPDPASMPDEVDAPSATSLAMIRQAESRQMQRLALLEQRARRQAKDQQAQGHAQITLPSGSVLSEEEMKRQDTAVDKAYAILLKLAQSEDDAQRAIAAKARGEILWMVGFLEGQQRADAAIALIERFLKDVPTDPARVALAYRAIEDRLKWANRLRPDEKVTQKWLDERHELFEAARREIDQFIKQYEDIENQKHLVQQARMLKVESFLTESQRAAMVSSVRAGGLKVRAAEQLLAIRQADPAHNANHGMPTRVYQLAAELAGIGQREMAIYLYSQVTTHFPTDHVANESVLRIAELYATNLASPLQAVEAYQEYLSLTGNNVSNYIFSIAEQLAGQKRYVEALHVYAVFVDSFPTDPRAPQALLAIGRTHQANESWLDAIKAYDRILNEYKDHSLIADTQLAIAECRINLSQWYEARRLYESFLRKYSNDTQAAMARSRIEILKSLDRYQKLLTDKEVTRNKDDAQFQIGRIVLERLNNRVKAIEEFDKVVKAYPESELADNAQLEIGKALLALGRLTEAREALLKVSNYTSSPLADNALYLIAQSYENEAVQLASADTATANKKLVMAKQEEAYRNVQAAQIMNESRLQARRKELSQMGGKGKDILELEDAYANFRYNGGDNTIGQYARIAQLQTEKETALQAANRQDRINEAYRAAVDMYLRAATNYPLGEQTANSLLSAAQILETKLKDNERAMQTYIRIVKFFPSSPVAEDAAWKVAQFHERQRDYEAAVDAYRDFIRKYPSSSRVPDAQFAMAESLEQLGRWVEAMDAYEVFRERFTQHPKADLAQEQINWIKAYRK